jgi:hypothetical protein
MRNVLRVHLDNLAQSFAISILDAVRGASLEELLAETSGGRRKRVAGRTGHSGPAQTLPKVGGRLARRSPAEIARALDKVIAVVKKKKGGLRAEQIRAALKMQRKELPRVLQEGLAKKKLKAKGQKRATTYTAG